MTGEDEVPYQALYRRFRPQRFSEVRGQEHVTRALRAAVRDAKVAHAYLFSGPRGTGKTSTARILAMALNCQQPQEGEPCGTCESCRAVRSGASLDVMELDSATNRGIDEMRDLLSRVALATPGRWKVYIVDEVHQITSAAASALLKTLEEPPGHVIFVLATTDPQKVLDTIRSRTQHFEFRLIGSEVLASLLADVAKEAHLDLPDEAIDVVVRRGHGSARDALSALDQVAAAGRVEDDRHAVSAVVECLAERDPAGALTEVAAAAASGLDARRLGTEILEHLRNGFLATRAPDLVLLGPAELEAVRSQAQRFGPAAIVRAMDEIGRALIDMRDAADARTTLEVALVRLAAPELDDTRVALVERIERLERALAAGGRPGDPGPIPPDPGSPAGSAPARLRSPGPVSASAAYPPGAVTRPPGGSSPSRGPAGLGGPPPMPGRPGTAPPPPAVSAPVAPRTGGDRTASPGGPLPSREELTLAWGDRILPSLRPAVKVYVANARFLPTEATKAVLALPDRGLLARAEANHGDLEAALSRHFGRSVPIALVLDDTAAPTTEAPVQPPSGTDGEEGEISDWAELEVAPGAPVTPEQRLLEAFPGAEEVY